MTPPAPTTSTRYQITRVIGEGAFGAVYEANRVGEGLSRRVAMKLLHATHTGKVGIEQRLRDEARMLSLIHHRAIVRVDDLIQLDGAWCVVMEYVDGLDIAGLLDVGPLPPRAALEVAAEVANALHAAYAQTGSDGQPLRLVHRDIKPANIRITPQGEVKLLDFGIARAEFQTREAATINAGFGTIIYMAPERFRGEDTTAGDVYALGVTLFEMLTAEVPGESAADADRHPPGKRFKKQWAWIQELSPNLLSLILEMLADEVEDRPSAKDCARRLGRLLQTLPGEALDDWAPVHVPAAAAKPQESSRGPAINQRKSPSQGTSMRVGMTVGGGTIAPAASRSSLTMSLTTEPDAPRLTPAAPLVARTRPPTQARPGALVVVLVGLLAVALFLFVVTGAIGVWAHYAGGDPSVAATPESATNAGIPAPASALPGSRPATLAATAPAATAPTAASSSTPGVSPSSSPGSPQHATRSSTPSTTGRAPTEPSMSPARPPSAGTAAAKPVAAAQPMPAAVVPSTPPAPARLTGAIVFAGDPVPFAIAGAPSPRAAPPGTYSASVTFPNGVVTVSGIVVQAGRTTRVKCAAQFASCSVAAPE